jgi:hypothetical protein
MPIHCARCDTPLPKWELATSDICVCTACSSRNTVRAFPAMLAMRTAPVTEMALEGEAACFDHPGKRAVAACGQCGRFVCQLCSVAFGDGVLCPNCVAAGSGQAQAAKLETSRTLYDSIALLLPLASLPAYPLTLLTAPASLILTAMKWRAPLSLVRRNRWRFAVAIAVSLTEIVLWILFVIGIAIALKSRMRRP